MNSSIGGTSGNIRTGLPRGKPSGPHTLQHTLAIKLILSGQGAATYMNPTKHSFPVAALGKSPTKEKAERYCYGRSIHRTLIPVTAS